MNAIIEGVENAMRFQSLNWRNDTLMRIDSKLTQLVTVIGEWVSVMRDSVPMVNAYTKDEREEKGDGTATKHSGIGWNADGKSMQEYATLYQNNSRDELKTIAANSNEKGLTVTNELLASVGETSKAVGLLTNELKTTNSGIEKFAGVVTTTGQVAASINTNTKLAQGLNGELSMYETVKAAVESIETIALITTTITGWGGVAIAPAAMAAGIYEYYDDLDKRQKAYAATVKKEHDQSDKTFYMSEVDADKFSNGLADIYDRVTIAAPMTVTDRKMSENPREAIKQKYGEQAYYLGYEPKLSVRDNVLDVSQLGAMTKGKEIPITKGFWQQMSPVYGTQMSAGQISGLEGFVAAYYNEVGAAKKYDYLHKSKTAEMVLPTGQTAFADLYQTANKSGNNKPDVQYMLKGEHTNSPVHETGKKAITINLNRPMIEHFTVHVGNSKEGVGELKRAVEEVLLEILNSVNHVN